MSSEDIKNNLVFLHTQGFGNDFFLGMSSSNVNSINKKTDSPLFFKKNHPFSVADDPYYETELAKYKQDIEFIKQSGILNFRFSLSWSRILPDGIDKINKEAVDFYNDILDLCIENGVEPFVSLYDSFLPASLEKKGGWSNRKILDWFEDYVTICVQVFKGKVNHWIVFNDPSVFTGASNFLAIYPSGKNSVNSFLSALHHTLLCQSIGFKRIKQIENKAQVGTFFSCNYVVPMTFTEKDLKAVERIDALLNRIFIEPALGLGYPIETLPFLKSISKYRITGDDDLIKVDFDFIGLQNCTREIVCHNLFIPYLNAKILQYDKLRVKKNHLSPEFYHELIYLIIKKYSKYEGVKKIFVNEFLTSHFDSNDLNANLDAKKINPIQSYLQQILTANKSGGKVYGYFVAASKEMNIQ
jgi:beta-glucosidase